MKQFFCLGTYTEPILFGTGEVFQGKGKGVSICSFEDGKIETLTTLPVRNPSFVAIDEEQRKIYAVNEMKEYGGAFGGGLTQIGYEPDGTMQIEADFNTAGTDPCHVEIAPNGAFVSVANFASGAVTIFPRDAQGDLQADKTIFQHEGSSVHPIRQKGPHAHSSLFAPDCPLMFVPDLGMDKVVAYRYDGASVCVDEDATITVERGCGPRYGEFAPNGKDFYLINEIGSRVMHYRYSAGNMTLCEETSTLPYGFTGENICSDLHITADGKFLYASNRGHDSITAYHILEDGSLAWIECQPSGGKTPRNFALDRTGRYLLAENQDSDNITVFAIGEDGRLTKQESYAFGSPVCIRFFKKTAFWAKVRSTMFTIVKRRELNPTVTELCIHAPLIAKKAKAGQFIIVRAKEDSERIPLTIAGFDREAGTVSIIFQVVGAGTMQLNSLKEGEAVHDFVGPLGKAMSPWTLPAAPSVWVPRMSTSSTAAAWPSCLPVKRRSSTPRRRASSLRR